MTSWGLITGVTTNLTLISNQGRINGLYCKRYSMHLQGQSWYR